MVKWAQILLTKKYESEDRKLKKIVYPDSVLKQARSFINSSLYYEWTEKEKQVLELFFTNTNSRVFFFKILPPNVVATLLSMFSRIKNPRGLRGVFVDVFLPNFLATRLKETEDDFDGDPEKYLRHFEVKCLDDFLDIDTQNNKTFLELLQSIAVNPTYFEELADSAKARKFLSLYLEKYGHNSIARMASLSFGVEQVSILAAKSLEWNRPGSGFVELSTRYVDMAKALVYPIAAELEAGWGVKSKVVSESLNSCFNWYKDLEEVFSEFLFKEYANIYADDERSFKAGVFGEVCDVLGNLLPAATLTSLGVTVSGEAFQSLLKHLYLDNLPETIALAELILEESRKVGGGQFAQHYLPTDWERYGWKYLPYGLFVEMAKMNHSYAVPNFPEGVWGYIDSKIAAGFGLTSMEQVLDGIRPVLSERGEFGKLPRQFETETLGFKGVMSFRGWRDLHRMGFSCHQRTLLTPFLGPYEYDKPAPERLNAVFLLLAQQQEAIYGKLAESKVPVGVRQYILSMLHRVGFTKAANLRQWEFCNWQRSKFSVNHEVRQVLLSTESLLQENLYWWREVSRADTTPVYIFARGSKGVPWYEKALA